LTRVDLGSDVFASFEIFKDFVHFVDKGCEACQLLNFLVRNDDSSDSFCQIDQERGISDIISGDGTTVGPYLLDILFLVGPKDRKPQDGETHHDSPVFDEHGVKNTHK